MLTELHLKNFRGFDDHTLPFRERTIAVGANNAGKSTIVEALRLIAIITSRYKTLTYVRPPDWLDEHGAHFGIEPSLNNFEINFRNIFHRYGEPPAIITATFSSGSSIKIFIGPDGYCIGCVKDETGRAVTSRARAGNVAIPSVTIMPQIGPVRTREEVLNADYVRRAAYSNVASLHFRNQLHIFTDLLPQLRDAVSATWPGVRIEELIAPRPLGEQIFHLQIRNEDFVGEVGTMGHGLQMWLQTMWFICRARGGQTLILDEPDVYMHADMQRRLIRFIRNQFPQVILTTHSAEIMSEVEPEQILIVDKSQDRSCFASNLPAVQSLLKRIGSAQNLHIARLWNSRRLVLVEGKDLKLLKILQNKIHPNSATPIDSIPNMPIGGWGGWNYAIGSNMLMRNAVNEEIISYCIFDSDYHTEAEINLRYQQATDRNVNLHIWSKKEIENYLLVASAIQRFIENNAGRRTNTPTITEIQAKLEEISDALEDSIFDAIASEYLSINRAGGNTSANRHARSKIAQVRQTQGSILSIASGKEVISRMSEWSHQEFGVSFNSTQILSHMNREEIPQELQDVINAIERIVSFTRTHR